MEAKSLGPDSFCLLPRRAGRGKTTEKDRSDFTPGRLGRKASRDGKFPVIEEGEPFIYHRKMG